MLVAVHKAVASVLADGTAARNMSGGGMLNQAEAAQLAGKVAEIVAREVAAGGLDVSAINQGPGPAPTGTYQPLAGCIGQQSKASQNRRKGSGNPLAGSVPPACLCQALSVQPAVRVKPVA